MVLATSLLTTACGSKENNSDDKFDYSVEKFADLQILRYKVPSFEELSLKEKELIYYLSEAALEGRDILFDQNGKYNLRIRRMLEAIYCNYAGDKNKEEYKQLETYLKRVWFANGIHHHYGCEKFIPGFTPEYLKEVLLTIDPSLLPVADGQSVEEFYAEISPAIFDSSYMAKRVNQADGEDVVVTSACNYYDNVTQAEVEEFYGKLKNPNDKTPVSYGLNSRLVKEDGVIAEKVWKVGGLYSPALEKVVYWLRKAEGVAENDNHKAGINKLIDYYETGEVKTFDEYAISWLQDMNTRIDFVNGFTERYGDTLGRTASSE